MFQPVRRAPQGLKWYRLNMHQMLYCCTWRTNSNTCGAWSSMTARWIEELVNTSIWKGACFDEGASGWSPDRPYIKGPPKDFNVRLFTLIECWVSELTHSLYRLIPALIRDPTLKKSVGAPDVSGHPRWRAIGEKWRRWRLSRGSAKPRLSNFGWSCTPIKIYHYFRVTTLQKHIRRWLTALQFTSHRNSRAYGARNARINMPN